MPDGVVVKTAYGDVRGHTNGKGIHVWKGIPYARPPVGEMRFRAAQPHDGWQGVRDASNYGPSAPQNRKKTNIDEDCLTLNIWSNGLEERKPVMFYIHGGSFVDGAGSDPEYEGTNLAQEGVVLVTFNYRLGVIGFLDFSFLGEDFVPNCGLTDILAALRWTYENIAAFGGDPQNITVFGQSAGATICSVLSVMPAARPYISKIIMMSGGPTLPHPREQHLHTSRKFLEFMEIQDGAELCVRPAMELAEKQAAFASWCKLGTATYSVEVDGELVPGYPIPLAAGGGAKDIPLLVGTTREEMSFMFVKPFNRAMDVGGVFEAGVDGEQQEDTLKIRSAYERYGDRMWKTLMSDLVFRMPNVWFAEAYANHAPVWMYRYDYESPTMKLSKLHAFHSSDLPLVFGNYAAGIARFLYSITQYKKHFKALEKELRGDFVRFAGTGALDWERCAEGSSPAKCYDRQVTVEPVVPHEVKAAYEGSGFHSRSMAGKSNNLRED